MKHYPGPWGLFGSNYHDHIEVQARVKGELVTLAKVVCPEADMHGPMPCEDPQAVANALLICAAPDLLVACERAEAFLGELRRHLPDLRAVHCGNVLETLRAAIAKATGGR